MALFTKLTKNNIQPSNQESSWFVRAGLFNTLVNTLNNMFTSLGVIKLDTIAEYTSANGVAVDGVTLKDGGITTTSTATLGAAIIASGIEDIAAGGTTTALDLTKSVHTVGADAGGDIFTLADGTAGQITTIICADATGTSTITPATFNGGTSITFDALGDSVTLQFVDTLGWTIIGGNSYTIV